MAGLFIDISNPPQPDRTFLPGVKTAEFNYMIRDDSSFSIGLLPPDEINSTLNRATTLVSITARISSPPDATGS